MEGIRVLIVEDEQLLSDLLERAIQRINPDAECVVARNAAQACEVIAGLVGEDLRMIIDGLLADNSTGDEVAVAAREANLAKFVRYSGEAEVGDEGLAFFHKGIDSCATVAQFILAL